MTREPTLPSDYPALLADLKDRVRTAQFRTHDVRATRRTLDMVAVIRGDVLPARAVRGLA